MPSLQSLYEAQSGLRFFYPMTGNIPVVSPNANLYDYGPQGKHFIARRSTQGALIWPPVTTGFFGTDQVANIAATTNRGMVLPSAVPLDFHGKTILSFACRIRVTATPSDQTVIGLSLNTAGGTLLLVQIKSTGTLRVFAAPVLGDSVDVTTGTPAISINTDHQLLVTINLTTDHLQAYVDNGRVINSLTGWTNTTFATTGVNEDYHQIGCGSTGTNPLQGKIGYVALFDTDVTAAQAGFVAATSGLGFKDATIGTPLSNLANGTYRLRVYDSADKDSITRIVWNGNITLTAGTSSTVVESSVPDGNLAYCVLTSQPANQTDQGANTFAGPLVLNHV